MVAIEGRIRIPYRWPVGQAATHFFRVLQNEGRLLGLRCGECGKVTVPPRSRCLGCHVRSQDWVEVGLEGTITTFTVCRAASPPLILALILLDGADTALLHRVVGTAPSSVRSGLRVRAVLRDQREGHINDLEGFRLID